MSNDFENPKITNPLYRTVDINIIGQHSAICMQQRHWSTPMTDIIFFKLKRFVAKYNMNCQTQYFNLLTETHFAISNIYFHLITANKLIAIRLVI